MRATLLPLLGLILALPAPARDLIDRTDAAEQRRQARESEAQEKARDEAALAAGGYLDAKGQFLDFPPGLRGKKSLRLVFDADLGDIVGFLTSNPIGDVDPIFDLDGRRVGGRVRSNIVAPTVDPITDLVLIVATGVAGKAAMGIRVAKAAASQGGRMGARTAWLKEEAVADSEAQKALRDVYQRIHGGAAGEDSEPNDCGADWPRASLRGALEKAVGESPVVLTRGPYTLYGNKSTGVRVFALRGGECFWVKDAAKTPRNLLDAEGGPIPVNLFEPGAGGASRQRLKTASEYARETRFLNSD